MHSGRLYMSLHGPGHPCIRSGAGYWMHPPLISRNRKSAFPGVEWWEMHLFLGVLAVVRVVRCRIVEERGGMSNLPLVPEQGTSICSRQLQVSFPSECQTFGLKVLSVGKIRHAAKHLSLFRQSQGTIRSCQIRCLYTGPYAVVRSTLWWRHFDKIPCVLSFPQHNNLPLFS